MHTPSCEHCGYPVGECDETCTVLNPTGLGGDLPVTFWGDEQSSVPKRYGIAEYITGFVWAVAVVTAIVFMIRCSGG